MKILIDTNVILDVLLNRGAFYHTSRAIFELAERKQIIGCINASVFTDIFYIISKEFKNIESVYKAIKIITALFSIVPVSETTITSAIALHWKDFEDAVQCMAAKENDIAYIITRDKAGYENSTVPCMTPTEFILFFKK